MMKILIINHEPLLERNYNYYDISRFKQRGVDVDYLCLNKCLENIVYNNIIDYSCATSVDSFAEFMIYLKGKTYDACFLEVPFTLKTYKFYREINNYFSTILKTDFFYQSVFQNTTGRLNKIKKYLSLLLSPKGIKRIVCSIINKIALFYFKKKGFRCYDLVFTPGHNGGLLYKNSININHPDYEKCLEQKPVCSQTKNLVFLDNYLPYHPDYKILKKKTVEPTKYFRTMNHFFSLLEEETGLDVVIAAHPKADYTDEFGSRKVIMGRSSQLVKNAEMVIAHHSLSINYAIYYDKPLLLIKVDDFYKHKSYRWSAMTSIGQQIDYLSNLLNIPILQENSRVDIPISKISNYSKYLYDFIVGHEDRKNVDIFIENILKRESK